MEKVTKETLEEKIDSLKGKVSAEHLSALKEVMSMDMAIEKTTVRFAMAMLSEGEREIMKVKPTLLMAYASSVIFDLIRTGRLKVVAEKKVAVKKAKKK